jgi:hypothetical protein
MKLFFPLLIAGLMVCAAVPYLLAGDWRHGLYWLFAAGINVVVTI